MTTVFSERGKPISRKKINSAKPEIIGGSKNGKKITNCKNYFIFPLCV